MTCIQPLHDPGDFLHADLVMSDRELAHKHRDGVMELAFLNLVASASSSLPLRIGQGWLQERLAWGVGEPWKSLVRKLATAEHLQYLQVFHPPLR